MEKQNSYKSLLLTIIEKKLPDCSIYLFGSRARKEHLPESDIDIAIDARQKIAFALLGEIKEAIEESIIPFSVDVVDLNNVSEELKQQILKDGVVWKS